MTMGLRPGGSRLLACLLLAVVWPGAALRNISQVLRQERARAEALWRRGRGLLWFQHLRRAGGTSLCHLLQEGALGAKFLTERGEACQPEDWKLRDALAICEHNMTLLEAELDVLEGNAFAQEYGPMPGQELLGSRAMRARMSEWVFVLSLRHPWDRFWSQLRYEMAMCLVNAKVLATCVSGDFEKLGMWWSPTSHPDSILGVPEARAFQSPVLYVDNYYTRIILNRTDITGPPLDDDDLEAAKMILANRVSVIVIAEDFAHTALGLACTLGLDFEAAKPLLYNRVRPYEGQKNMIADIPKDSSELGEKDVSIIKTMFRKRNQYDYALFQYARALSRRNLIACGRANPRVEELRLAPAVLQYKQDKPEEEAPPLDLTVDDLFGCSGGSLELVNGTYLLKCPRNLHQASASWWTTMTKGQPKRKRGQRVPGHECWKSGFSWVSCCHEDYGPKGNPECWDLDFTFKRCCVTE